jgi:Cu-Zn family superoxide dismutase
MTLRTLPALVALALPLAAAAATPGAVATLKDADGKEVGKATFASVKQGVKIQVTVAGLTPGKHGIHLHEAGKCDPPDFKSAGAHLNPAQKHHGLANPEGPHEGDLPNLVVGKDGKAKASFTAKGATLGEGKGSLLGPEGTALVIHADPDDEKSDPAGNSGARIACGVVQRK